MTRDFIFTWSERFTNQRVPLDPVGLEDWNCALTMVYWVAGHAVYGQPTKWQEPRRSDTVEITGPGAYQGILAARSFTIQDTLFMEDYDQKKPRKPRAKKNPYAIDIEAHVPALGNAVYRQFVVGNLGGGGQGGAAAQVDWAEVGRPQVWDAGGAAGRLPPAQQIEEAVQRLEDAHALQQNRPARQPVDE